MSQVDIASPGSSIARFEKIDATRFDNAGRGLGQRGDLTAAGDFKALLAEPAEPDEPTRSRFGAFGTDRATRADRADAQARAIDRQFTADPFGPDQFTASEANDSDRSSRETQSDRIASDDRVYEPDAPSANVEQGGNEATNGVGPVQGGTEASDVKPAEATSTGEAEARDRADADSDSNAPSQQIAATDPAVSAPNLASSQVLHGLLGEGANILLDASLAASAAGLAGANGSGQGTAKNEGQIASDALASAPGANIANGNASVTALALAAGTKSPAQGADKSRDAQGAKDDPKSGAIDKTAGDGAPAPGTVDAKPNPAIEPLARTNVPATPNIPGNNQSSGANPAGSGSNPGVTGLEGVRAASPEARGADGLASAQNVAPRLNPDSLPGLAARIARKSDGGNSVFDLRLDPAELGQIQVRIEIDADKQARAHIVAERPEALAELARNARILENALRQSGVSLNPEGVRFSLASDDQSRGFSSNGSGQNNSAHDNTHARRGLSGERHHSRLDLPDQALAQALSRVHSSRLNLLA